MEIDRHRALKRVQKDVGRKERKAFSYLLVTEGPSREVIRVKRELVPTVPFDGTARN